MMPRTTLLVACAALAATLPAAFASHADGSYDQPVWFQWAETNLDVVIVPPEHGQIYNGGGILGGAGVNELNPYANSYMQAINNSVKNHKTAISTYAPTWLKNGITINVHILGQGQAFTGDAEIIITTDQTKLVILGMAVSTNPCIVDNSKFFITSYTYNDMYNINAHEFGHCLGLDHVLGEHPINDILVAVYPQTPGSTSNVKNCVSNLNVKGLEGVFAKALSQPITSWGKTGTVSAGAYAQTC